MTRRSWLVGTSFGSGVIAGPEALSGEEVRALLRAVADFYTQGAMYASVRARVRSEWEADARGKPEQIYTLHRSGKLLHLDFRFLLDMLYIVGADRSWYYRPFQHEYTETPGTEARTEEIRGFGRNWFFRYVDRFVLLSKFESEARFMRWEKLKKRGGARHCAVISMKAMDPSQSWWKELLWIEPNTGIIWKIVRIYEGGVRENVYYSRGTGTIEWDFIVLGEPPDPDLFVFHPPRGARLVKQFSPYQGR